MLNPKRLEPERVDELVHHYVQLRDKLKQMEMEYEESIKPFKEVKEEIASHLMAFLDSTGQTAAKTKHGTVSTYIRPTAALNDAQAFISFVREHDLYMLMNHAANAKACMDFAEENGTLPPGVTINSLRIVSVRAK